MARGRERSLEVPPGSRREAVLAFVAAHPGCSTGEVKAAVGLGRGDGYHLERLRKAGKVVDCKAFGVRAWWVNGAAPPMGERAVACVLRSEPARVLLAAVRASPGLALQEAARRVGLKAQSVAFQAERLERAGLLRRARMGRGWRLHPAGGVPPEGVGVGGGGVSEY